MSHSKINRWIVSDAKSILLVSLALYSSRIAEYLTRYVLGHLCAQMEDLVFSDFCAEIGVDSIRDYEQKHLKLQTEFDKKQ